jgi:hypothetical protein
LQKTKTNGINPIETVSPPSFDTSRTQNVPKKLDLSEVRSTEKDAQRLENLFLVARVRELSSDDVSLTKPFGFRK